MKFLYTLAAGILVAAVLSGVACTLVCSHDCCPHHDNAPAQNCLNSHFTSSEKFEKLAVLNPVIHVEGITHHVGRVPNVVEASPDLRPTPHLSILRI